MRKLTFRTALISVITLILMSACHTTRDLSYLSNLPAEETGTLGTSIYDLRIEPNDELLITVNSTSPKATAQYNLPLVNPALESDLKSATTPSQQTYIVNSKGNINMPVIGTMHVAGFTIDELTDTITSIVKEKVNDPIVRAELVNFKVSVIGEVGNPQTISSPSKRISVFDALAKAGDITAYGRKESVIILREENGTKSYHRLNLQDASVASSPYFYLKQNDVVIVEPNDIKQANSKYNQNNAYKLSVISTIVSATSVVASLIIALSVK